MHVLRPRVGMLTSGYQIRTLYELSCDVCFVVSPITGTHRQLECGPMPNVMVTLPNIGGALCSTLQSLADANYLTAVQ